MTHDDFVKRVTALFPRSSHQLNAPFSADAELVCMGGMTWAFTMDEFSAEEDGLSLEDPQRLGRNLAVATLSDLLAVGARPQFFMQALVLPADKQALGLELVRGVRSILDHAGCFLLGGDTGQSDGWRFTGMAAGAVADGRVMTRSFAGEDGVLWCTGQFGDANAAFLDSSLGCEFELRQEVADAIAGTARGCIDTSGGFLGALQSLAEVNPRARIEVDVGRIPLAAGVARAAARQGVPPAAALVGGAGEYELLFQLPVSQDQQLARRLTVLGARPIGRIRHDLRGGVYVLDDEGNARRAPACPDARDFSSFQSYIQAVVRVAGVFA